MDTSDTQPRWSVVIADDHPVVRLGVRIILDHTSDFRIVGEAGDGVAAVDLVRETRPDLLLLDLAMPALPGLDALRQLADELATLKTVILTASIEHRHVVEALQLGAKGIVLKGAVAEHLVEALRAVLAGRYWIGGRAVDDMVTVLREVSGEAAEPTRPFTLTPRELDVVGAIVEGCPNRDIARRFSISEDTVKRHLTNIFNKTGVSSRLELAMYALHHRLIPPA